MPRIPAHQPFNIVIIGQAGRIQYETALFAASLRHCNPEFTGTLYVGEPQPGPHWPRDPRMAPHVRSFLEDFGAKIIPFETKHFGADYPQGNKIEVLAALPENTPFIFFDSDTLITGPLSQMRINFSRPTASMRREDTWPMIELYGPGYAQTWKSLYDMFGLAYESSLDLSHPDEYWQRYLYFNAGWFLGPCPKAFGTRFMDYATAIREHPPQELVCQSLDPWLDQVALPLAIHGLGGGRPGPELAGLDGEISCHWRIMPLMYARESDQVIETLETITAPNKIKKLLKEHDPFKRMIYQRRGHKVRALFDRNALPRKEQAIRNRIKKEGYWMR